MKRHLITLAGFAAFGIVSCSKQEDDKTTISTWREVSTYFSPGTAELIWHPTAAADAEIIEFKQDNVFYSSAHPQLNRYLFQDASTGSSHNYLKVYRAGSRDTTTWFVKHVSENTLELGYMCIEGCGKKFERVHEEK